MNVYEMESAVRSALKVSSTTMITSAEVLSALNDGYKDVASKALCIEEETLLPIEENEKIIASGGLKVQYAQITDAVLAEVSYTVTAPVGYDTWVCDSTEYQGKILTAGPGMMYDQAWKACDAAAGLTGDVLILIYPGTHVTQPGWWALYSTQGTALSYRNFHFHGVGNISYIVISSYNCAFLAGYSNTVIEGLTINQVGIGAYPPFTSGNYNPSTERHIYNKCISTQDVTNSVFWQFGQGITDIRNMTVTCPSSLSYRTIHYQASYHDNTLDSIVKTYFSKYNGISGGTGSLGVLDYVEIPTINYGHEYGDDLVTDWEFDGTKKKMSYGGGAAVDVAAGGSFTLTNTDGASIDIYVVADDLPASDDTFTIYNSKYVNGVIIV